VNANDKDVVMCQTNVSSEGIIGDRMLVIMLIIIR